jgi:hypothetical protein
VANYWRVLQDVRVSAGTEEATFFTGDLISPYNTAFVAALDDPPGVYITDSGILAPVPAGSAPVPVYGYVTSVDGASGDVNLETKYVQTINGVGPDTAGDVAVVGGGSGTVTSVNGVAPDGTGDVTLDVSGVVDSVAGRTGAVVLAAADIASGVLNIARIPTGTTGTTAALGNDSRFTDARTPTAHASSHDSAGSDPVSPASIGAETPTGAQAKVDAAPGNRIVFYDTTTGWPARPSGTTPVIYKSLLDSAAPTPTDMALGDEWFRRLG